MPNRWIFAACLFLVWPSLGWGEVHSATVPLRDGRLSTGQFLSSLDDADLPPGAIAALSQIGPSVDLRGVAGWVIVRGLNTALGDGFHLSVTPNALIVQFDPDKLPRDWDQTADALGRFTEVAAPEATARQNARFGLHFSGAIDPQKPMVVLVHGLEGDAASCGDLAKLLNSSGYQTAFFAYPGERSAARNAALFAQQMIALHQQYPKVRVDLVTESMGALLARDYVEGPEYLGGVDHLIMIAPPNGGSRWAPYSILLKLAVNSADWWSDPQWSPAWMITEGIGQSMGDLMPNSHFLNDLNSRPRRAGVDYTIVAGDRPPGFRYEAKLLEISGWLIPDGVRGAWGVRQIDQSIQSRSRRLLDQISDGDGPVNLDSARLAGVSDFVVVAADHVALYESVDGQPPAAWPTIRDRLSH